MTVTVPAEVLQLARVGATLRLVLQVGADQLLIEVGLNPRTQAALPLVVGLFGHDLGCPGSPDIGVGLLLRTAAAAGATPVGVVVRPGAAPQFWLRLHTVDGQRDVDLDVLDSVGLLVSGRLPVAVAGPGPVTDWDAEMTRLLGGEHP